MARRANPNPPLKWDEHARQFCVMLGGKKYRLGPDQATAEERRRKLLGEWLLSGQAPSPPPKPPGPAPSPRPVRLSVSEALLAYYHAVEPRLGASQLERIERAARAARKLYAALPADEFDQLHLQAVRKALLAERFAHNGPLVSRIRELLAPGPMPAREFLATLRAKGYSLSAIWQARRRLGVRGRRGPGGLVQAPEGGFPEVEEKPLSRRFVNSLIGVLQTAWKWMAGQKIVPGSLAVDLAHVRALREREGGRETAPVLPADPAAVAATLPFLGRVVRAMVEVHRVTGMRPEEVCNLRRCDISLSPGEKVYAPLPDGKRVPVTAVEVEGQVYWVYAPATHKTRGKRKWRAVVIPPAAQAWLLPFLANREANAYLFSPREASDEWREQRGRKKRYGKGRCPGRRYGPESYREAVKRAARQAGVEPWVPSQLRHSVASEGLEVGRDDEVSALLGHASTDMVSTYAQQALRKAAALAARLGAGPGSGAASGG